MEIQLYDLYMINPHTYQFIKTDTYYCDSDDVVLSYIYLWYK